MASPPQNPLESHFQMANSSAESSRLNDQEFKRSSEDEVVSPGVEEVYDLKSFDTFNVSPEVKQLFSYIGLYTPRNIDLDVKLKPFIPEYVPAVGDTDPFLKIPRPDGVDDGLGLVVLDEPSLSKQSDVALLSLKLKALNKDINVNVDPEKEKIKTVTSALEIDNWIENIRKLRQETSSVSTQVVQKNLPDVEGLMQEWDAEFEQLLKTVSLPSADTDCPLDEYVTIICALLDIPIHGSKIASLQTLFSLYNEFRTSQHFKQIN